MDAQKDYWDERGLSGIYYRNEFFYTITPLPYYYKRRQRIIDLLTGDLKHYQPHMICDYGCGDGYYSNRLIRDISCICIDGYDISESMSHSSYIGEMTPETFHFHLTNGNADELEQEKYDLVYIIAVLAHISDDKVQTILKNVRQSLKLGGHVILCEQVGKTRTEGNSYTRRTIDEYKRLLSNENLFTQDHYLIDYWMHRVLMERRIAKLFYRFQNESDESLRRINANRSWAFRFLSSFFTFLSIPNTFHLRTSGWGYLYITAEKKAHQN